jgi:ribosome-dependent ATPase
MHASLGAYTKGLGFNLMRIDLVFMLCCIPVLLAISWLGLRKQEK